MVWQSKDVTWRSTSWKSSILNSYRLQQKSKTANFRQSNLKSLSSAYRISPTHHLRYGVCGKRCFLRTCIFYPGAHCDSTPCNGAFFVAQSVQFLFGVGVGRVVLNILYTHLLQYSSEQRIRPVAGSLPTQMQTYTYMYMPHVGFNPRLSVQAP